MDSIQIAFCDDDAAFRDLLSSATKEIFSRNGIQTDSVMADSAEALDSALRHRSIDLLFLDIDMPGMDGIRYGEQLRTLGFDADIIYVSNMDDKVYEIFRVHPWSFIRKSRYAEELSAVIDEYVRARKARQSQIVLPLPDGGRYIAEPRSILYVESSGKNQKLVFTNGGDPILVRLSLHELEVMLLPHGFIRIHKGFLVNYLYIKKITSRALILDTGDDLPIGRDRLKSVRESYLTLMKWKGLNPRTKEGS